MALERFLNHALGAGVRLAHVERMGRSAMTMELSARDFLRKLPAIRRKCRCRVHILRRRGVPFHVMRLWRRKVLLFGGALCAAALAFASTRVWRIAVEGVYRVPEAVVLRAVEEAGVAPGVARRDVVNTALARAVNDYDGRIAWAGVSVEGVTLTVRVVEAQEIPQLPDHSQPMDVVAAKDGVIERVTALRGKAAVKPGDAVRAGAVLIAGDITREDAPESLLVHAEGEVLARVWYTVSVSLPREQEQLAPSGESAPYRAMRLAGLPLYETQSPYAAYDLALTEEWRVSGLVLPLVQLRGAYYALTPQLVEQPREELAAQAAFRAELGALEQVPETARILEKQVDLVWEESGGVCATARVCALEDIGSPRAATVRERAAQPEE